MPKETSQFDIRVFIPKDFAFSKSIPKYSLKEEDFPTIPNQLRSTYLFRRDRLRKRDIGKVDDLKLLIQITKSFFP